jgi:hypothetical protein
MAHNEYKRKLDAIMSAAERSVAPNMQERSTTGGGSYYGGGGGAGALGAMNPNHPQNYRSSGGGGYADPAAGMSHTSGSSSLSAQQQQHMPAHMQQVWENREEDFGRQLRVCMKEVAELRSELSAEREGRHALQQLIAKRSKEEVLVEVHTATNHMRQEMRELEVAVQQRLQDSEAGRSVDRRKVDDALRLLKTQERSHFDIAEQYRDQLEEMRQRVDGCVSSSNAVKAEVTHQLENEKGRMEHRLDVELERYSEMHRQHQTALSDTRHVVQREVAEVSKTVKTLVETTWDERVKALQKMLNESLYKYQRTQEQQTDSVSTLSGQVANYLRESKRDLSSNTAELRDRLAILEGNAPILASQMDRVQRKADTAVESNSKIGALVDVLREAADKATAQALRSSERAQKVEDTMSDRDGRIFALESQTTALAGFERLRNDLDATKRSVQRVEGQTETVRQIADRCERQVQDTTTSFPHVWSACRRETPLTHCWSLTSSDSLSLPTNVPTSAGTTMRPTHLTTSAGGPDMCKWQAETAEFRILRWLPLHHLRIREHLPPRAPVPCGRPGDVCSRGSSPPDGSPRSRGGPQPHLRPHPQHHRLQGVKAPRWRPPRSNLPHFLPRQLPPTPSRP